jgi:protoporphyrinogen oxidase
MDWWLKLMPVEANGQNEIEISYQNKKRKINTSFNKTGNDDVLLVRKRKSRIFYKNSFFDYPITLSLDTIQKLGLWHTLKIGVSYIHASLFPIKKEENLEQFFINRFGKVLYKTFFKSYTEKVWGVKCTDIDASWGAQRIKGLSILKTIQHILKKSFSKKKKDIGQKSTETSLIEYFLYPKYGPGQMWDLVGNKITESDGLIIKNAKVTGLENTANQITSVSYTVNNEVQTIKADYVISTMPVKGLVSYLNKNISTPIVNISSQLMYRDFITVGILLKKMVKGNLEDNWIYIQEPNVKVGRLQIFNNWSPFMVKDPNTYWIGLEYFCFENDDLWSMSEEEMKEFALKELIEMNFAKSEDYLDSVVIKMPKTYPAYFGVYDEFDKVKEYLINFKNLYPIGRNGMHKYNNQDHSMLTAMAAVEHICGHSTNKEDIWNINTEQEYHEEKE